MTHTKKEIKAAATETKAIKARRVAKQARKTAKEADKELKRLREGEFSKGTVVAAKSKMKKDRVAAKMAKEAVRVTEAQAQRHVGRLETAKARQAVVFQTRDEVQVPTVVRILNSEAHSGCSDAGNGPKAEAETRRAVLRARHDLEWAQLDEELERKRQKLKERHESEMAGLEVDLEMEEFRSWCHAWALDGIVREYGRLERGGLSACVKTNVSRLLFHHL